VSCSQKISHGKQSLFLIFLRQLQATPLLLPLDNKGKGKGQALDMALEQHLSTCSEALYNLGSGS